MVDVRNLLAQDQYFCFYSYMPTYTFFIRNHFISNLVLESQKFKKLSELQGKS